ncbi:ABC transporter permease [Oceanispirochaeta sp.]|jgi:ribose/xylose/arabinose/galactoside ABC-type transport system permease subunit|uniref:ABC transporter permease n=1 Tax=Oceanispirochaeta sp. TaxID=2035350 RepID=UPI00262D42FB|nr:ABC transporter permease [Oceanispirochaeta sp.]MDA3959058.1 ABC transporter permease [Oceanispirochaeta sp.]
MGLFVKFREASSVSGQLISLLIVIVLFTIGTGGRYLSLENFVTILSLAGIPMIISLGVHQIIIMGGMDLSLEGIIALCAVISGLLIKNQVTSIDIGMGIFPVVIIVGLVCGVFSGMINTKLKMPSFIATLGISWITFGLAVIFSGGISIPLEDLRFQNIMNGKFFGIPNITLIALAIFAVLYVFQKKTSIGKHMYAIGGDEILAKQAGVNVDRVKIIVFAMGGAIYGIAALFLVARLNSSAARLGNNLLFPAMTAVAVGGVSLSGGVGTALNAILGTLIVTALNNGMVLMHVSPYLQTAVNGIVLITAVALTIDRKKIGLIK